MWRSVEASFGRREAKATSAQTDASGQNARQKSSAASPQLCPVSASSLCTRTLSFHLVPLACDDRTACSTSRQLSAAG